MTRRNIFIVIAGLGLVLLATFLFFTKDVNAPASDTEENQSSIEVTQPEESFDKTRHSINELRSPWLIVNRERPLPNGYLPPDLNVPNVQLRLAESAEQMQFSEAATPALVQMFAAAEQDDVELVFGSGYRSEALQAQFYNSYVARDGQAAADRYSARPGTSEHQTGLAFDVTSKSGKCHLEICFEDLPEGRWVAENAHEYGFIIRYLDDKEDVTGYQYEPWHLRYVGVDLAAELYKNGQTMEEFFDL